MTRYQHGESSRAVLRSLVPVICPPEARPFADGIVDHIELTFGATPRLVRAALVTGLASYDALALPRYRKRARALTGAEADAYFESWRTGGTPVHRQFAMAVNQLMNMSCYEQPEMQRAIGYHVEDWIESRTHKRLTVYADAIERRAADLVAPDPLRPAAHRNKAVR